MKKKISLGRKPVGFSHRPAMALMVVIWIILILSMACLVGIKLVYSETEQTINRVQGARARVCANMGIAVAANPVIKRNDPLLAQKIDGEGYETKFSSEAAKINLNYFVLRKDDEFLRDLFLHWGLDYDEANNLIAALYDWVDEDDLVSPNGAELVEYEKMGFYNLPYNRAFYSLNELTLVRGWKDVEKRFPQWREWLTLWSKGKLDVNEVEPEILALACKVDVEYARRIREEVVGQDGILGTDDDVRKNSVADVLTSLGIPKGAQAPLLPRLTTQDTTTRIESVGFAGDQKRKIVLILGNRTGIPSLLERYEEILP